DGGARRRDQRGARPRGGGHRRRHARRRVSLLHGHARRRREGDRPQSAGGGRLDAPGRVDRRELTQRRSAATILEQAFHIVGETGTQAIDRAAALLVSVVESARPIAVGELAARTRLPKSTTSRLVAALERQGLVQRTGERGPLCPGPVLLRFAQSERPEANLVELSRPALAQLAEGSGETINLGVPTPLGVEHLAQHDSHHYVGGTNWVGRRVPHDCTANGKVFLAFGAAGVPDGFDERAPETIRSEE